MPWKVAPVSEIRLAFVHHVRSLHHSVAEACRLFGISRKTGYKWLARQQLAPEAPLADGSKRPHYSQRRTIAELEQALMRAKVSDRTHVIVIETDPTATTEAGGAWWDVAIPEVSVRAEVRAARAAYADQRKKRTGA